MFHIRRYWEIYPKFAVGSVHHSLSDTYMISIGTAASYFTRGSITRWFKYDRDKLWLVYTQIVPVIFEPPCKIDTCFAALFSLHKHLTLIYIAGHTVTGGSVLSVLNKITNYKKQSASW